MIGGAKARAALLKGVQLGAVVMVYPLATQFLKTKVSQETKDEWTGFWKKFRLGSVLGVQSKEHEEELKQLEFTYDNEKPEKKTLELY
jgi:hypothetical protein